nr:hypothetical protein Iba_chr05dCG2920 [Ipomoea batatas]
MEFLTYFRYSGGCAAVVCLYKVFRSASEFCERIYGNEIIKLCFLKKDHVIMQRCDNAYIVKAHHEPQNRSSSLDCN